MNFPVREWGMTNSKKPVAPFGYLTVDDAMKQTGKSRSMLCRAVRMGKLEAIRGEGKPPTQPYFIKFESLQRHYPYEVWGKKRTKWNYVRPDMPIISLYESNPEAEAEAKVYHDAAEAVREALDASG